MFHDRTLNLSFSISFTLHLLIMVILSIFIARSPKIQLPTRLIEVEILPLKDPLVTHMPKKQIRLQVKPKPRQEVKSIPTPQKVQNRISTIIRPEIGQELEITAVLGTGERSKKIPQESRVRYGVLPIEETLDRPHFERVEAGEVWGHGPLTTGERIVKGEPPSHIGAEGIGRPVSPQIEGSGPQRISPVSMPGGAGKIPYYHLEGPATVGREILYQELIPIPKWVEEEGRSLRGKLRFWVLPSGEVDRVIVEETFGYPQIDDLAMRTIRRWRFTRGKDEAWGMISIKIQLLKK